VNTCLPPLVDWQSLAKDQYRLTGRPSKLSQRAPLGGTASGLSRCIAWRRTHIISLFAGWGCAGFIGTVFPYAHLDILALDRLAVRDSRPWRLHRPGGVSRPGQRAPLPWSPQPASRCARLRAPIDLLLRKTSCPPGAGRWPGPGGAARLPGYREAPCRPAGPYGPAGERTCS
jgi:hypothetical protein